jgi:hypothetical protein
MPGACPSGKLNSTGPSALNEALALPVESLTESDALPPSPDDDARSRNLAHRSMAIGPPSG